MRAVLVASPTIKHLGLDYVYDIRHVGRFPSALPLARRNVVWPPFGLNTGQPGFKLGCMWLLLDAVNLFETSSKSSGVMTNADTSFCSCEEVTNVYVACRTSYIVALPIWVSMLTYTIMGIVSLYFSNYTLAHC